MKKLSFLFLTLLLHNALISQNTIANGDEKNAVEKIIFVTDGYDNKTYIQYIVNLTKKNNPKICFVPTASADNANSIVAWYVICTDLPLRPYVLKTFQNSSPSQQTFEEMIMSMDAIIVGGGNTLNMLAIWKAQGIDTVLRKAYEKGIVLAGGSAGSLCWFTGGYSDSRPKQLSIVDGLAFLNYSNCPHYHSEPSRKPLYFQAIHDGKLKQGYACDDMSALLFVNGVLEKSLSLDKENNNYFISLENGRVKEELIPSEIIR